MKKKVVIASLLHDVGKLLQRANNQPIYHGEVGKEYLKKKNFDDDILEAVLIIMPNNYLKPKI